MPKIAAATNAQQRENTRQAILAAFGQLLFERGLAHLTMTDVSRRAGVGRTAVYNYFAGVEELLVCYALEQTERFVVGLRARLEGVVNPVDRLGVYIAAQIEDLSTRHLPPGPALRSVLSQRCYDRLAGHVGQLRVLLEMILSEAMAEGYLLSVDVGEAVDLVHGSLAAGVYRGEDMVRGRQRVGVVVRFIQRGLGACFRVVDGREVAVRIGEGV